MTKWYLFFRPCLGETCFPPTSQVFCVTAVLFPQITGLARPALLERMSEILVQTGSNLDRGSSSSDITAFMTQHLESQELKALVSLQRRLQTLASAVYQKVSYFQ